MDATETGAPLKRRRVLKYRRAPNLFCLETTPRLGDAAELPEGLRHRRALQNSESPHIQQRNSDLEGILEGTFNLKHSTLGGASEREGRMGADISCALGGALKTLFSVCMGCLLDYYSICLSEWENTS